MNRNFYPKVGDLVRFRDWGEMAAEFGVEDDGWISCSCTINQEMYENLKDVEFVIEDIDDDIVQGHGTGYSVSFDMLEFVEDEEEYDTEGIDNFLGTVKIKE